MPTKYGVLIVEQMRNSTIDIVKAICICLMVIGHSGCPEYLNRFIYMFHMPCFFFISGWLLKDKYITDLKKGVLNKIKGSYYPFVKWSLIFLVFHNLLTSLHIYENSYSWHDFLVKTVRILTMTGSEQLLGGYWVLISLCWASLFTLLYLHIFNRKWKIAPIGIFIGIVGALLIAFFEQRLPIDLPQQLKEQTFLATAFYLSGYLFHKIDRFHKIPLVAGIGLLLIPAFVALYGNWSMIHCKGWLVIPYYFVALTGTLGIFSISGWLSQLKLSPLFIYIGNKTLYILTFHFLSFKLVSWVYISIQGYPMENLTQFPVLSNAGSYTWIIYSLVGVGLPLFIWKLFHISFKTSSLKFIQFNKQYNENK